ncbi:hypothetical protein LVY74_06700 [Acinetobacter sp. ME22]|nr:hypothetical protein [Acinetobacter sp. ME22]MCG2573247.1 hypothetical protein [Acinetobacter sp. ME22]
MQRPRRLRQNPVIRQLVREHQLDLSSLIYPIFIENCGLLK